MYAIKPWGKALLVGSSIGSYAMGIGMRLRETNVTVVERRTDPGYERDRHRRCLLTEHCIHLLTDLGCTEARLRSILHPARGWRFVSPQRTVLRESATFPGCVAGEPAYQCSEGALLRVLRTELLRFGGSVVWGAEVYGAFEDADDGDLWCVRKDYGLATKLEAVVTTARDSTLSSLLIAPDAERAVVVFDVQVGHCTLSRDDAERVFGAESDVAIVTGGGNALHCWRMHDGSCAWRLVAKARVGQAAWATDGVHPIVARLVNYAEGRDGGTRTSVPCALPITVPAIRDDAGGVRASVLGEGLLPIDAFEWRGDYAQCAIQEAASLCRALYGKKYHRGHAPRLLREMEQDCLARRANLLRRDLTDAEHLLDVSPQLQEDATARRAHEADTRLMS